VTLKNLQLEDVSEDGNETIWNTEKGCKRKQ